MNRYAVTLDFSATTSIEANSQEEAEEIGQGVDATEVLDNMSGATVIHIELEEENVDEES